MLRLGTVIEGEKGRKKLPRGVGRVSPPFQFYEKRRASVIRRKGD